MPGQFFRTLPQLDAHHRFFLALAVAAAALALGGAARLSWPACLLTAWDSFAVVGLALAWWRITRVTAHEAVRGSKLDDAPGLAIFGIVVFGACASLLGTGFLLSSAKTLAPSVRGAHVLLAGGTVLCSWLLIHTYFALHYTHLFYRLGDDSADAQTTEGSGVEFPGEKWPDYLDFAYFSFVIGMTSQVSDVPITARSIRRLALAHGALSFVFNTVILALSINLAASLV